MSSITKTQLASSLKRLTSKRCLCKITIKDLANDSGVNRQTFYYHFRDIYELLDWIFKREILDEIAEYRTSSQWHLGFFKLFQFVEDNKSFSLNLYSSLGEVKLSDFLNRVIFDILYTIVEELSHDKKMSHNDKIFLASFLTYGLVDTFLDWVKKGANEPSEAIMARLGKLVDGEMSRVIERYSYN